MSWRPAIAILSIVLSAIVPIDPDGPLRSFVNVEVAPYVKGVTLEVPFTYVATNVETTNITIHLSSDEASDVLLYARAIVISGSFSSTVTVDGRFLNVDAAMLKFVAWGHQFHVQQQLGMQARQTIELELGASSPFQMTISNHGLIDQYGVTRYLKESLSFEGFDEMIERPYYLDISLGMLAFRVNSEAKLPVTVSLISLLIEDHQQNFSLLRRSVDYTHAYINLKANVIDGIYQLAYHEPLYVNPTTFISSYFPIVGFVATNRLFLPKDRYMTINPLRLKFRFSVSIGNIYHIAYEPLYHFDKALLGSCDSALYCVKTSDVAIDVGNWKEIIVNG